jgi:flagellar motor protein MotB
VAFGGGKRLPLSGRPGPVRDEAQVRWLISYSDFMMQLVCLFILMYSVTVLRRPAAAADAGRTPPPELSPLLRDVEAKLRRFPEGGRIRLVPASDGFRLQILYEMFAEGSDALTAEGRALVDFAAFLLAPVQSRGCAVSGVGHAAPGEAGDGALGLSLARARSAWEWATRPAAPDRLDPARFEAAGRGARDPVADPASPATRPLNRRVDFLVRLP